MIVNQTLHEGGNTAIILDFQPGEGDLRQQALVFVEALRVMESRGIERGEVWKRSGIKGQVFQLFAKAERAFSAAMAGKLPNLDNYIDAINYAAFAYRLGGPGSLDGEWPWNG